MPVVKGRDAGEVLNTTTRREAKAEGVGKGDGRSRHALRQQQPPGVSPVLGARIRAARERSGLTQGEAGAPRYSGAYVSAVEHGHHLPSLEALVALAWNLGADPGDLLGRADAELPARVELARVLDTVQRDLLTATGERRAALLAASLVLERALPWLTEPDSN